MSYLILGPAYIVVYLAGAVILRTHAVAGDIYVNIALLPPALAALVEIFRRRRRSAGAQRLFWDSFLLGMTLWTTGHVAWAISNLVFHRSDWPAWHTLFTLSAGIGPLVAILTLPHRGRRERESGATAVALVSYTTLAGFIYAYFVLVPAVISGPGASQSETAMFAIVQIQRLLLIVALAGLTAAAWATAWRTTYLRLLGGAVAALGFRMAATTAIHVQAAHLFPVLGLAWIVPFLCYAWAAADAPSTPRASESVESAITNVPLSQVLAIPVLLIPAIGYVLTDAVPMGEPGDSVRLLLTTLTLIAGLGLLVLRLSMQGSELQRVDARVRLLAAATEQTEDIILITRADGAIEQANAAAVAALGCSRDELTSKTLYEVVEWGFEDTIDSIGAEVRRNGVWRGTLVHRRKNGTTFPAANTVVALRSDDGHVTHFVGVGRDITQELELRDQLVTTERMSAVGELIAGVAHEINNPLQTIIGSVELLMDERTGADRRDLELVRHEAARAGQIVRNLLAFVRHGAPDRAPVDLNQIVRATAAVREHHLRQVNIALELYLNPEPLTVLVNREEIQQVVFNLLLNAEHAIGDESGAIRIRTEAGEGVQHMTLTDTGPGVKPELRGRIFEPFFTTKQVGQGTGLGLSISLGIARSHGGILELVPSEPSGPRSAPSDLRPTGACFRLTLPAHSEARAAAAQGGGPHAEPARAAARPAAPAEAGAVIAEPQRRALVVDDEAPIRVLLGRLLTRRGFAVVQAGSLADARTAAGQHRFDLVLCDVRLGDGNGATFLTYLCEQHSDPDRRFVFITGDASAIEDQADLRSAAVLPKPFTSADLDAVLATVNVGA